MRDVDYHVLNSYHPNMKSVVIQSHPLLIRETPSAFQPARPSFILAENIRIKSGYRVCDVGTGCGLYAILAAKLGAQLSCGTDVLKDCIKISRQNAYLNQVSKNCIFKQGNLFEPIGITQFDVVISNPPQTPRTYLKNSVRKNKLSYNIYVALDGGDNGIDLPIKIISESSDYLIKGGRLYMLILKWHRWKDVVIALHNEFSTVEEIYSESVPYNNLSPSFLNNTDFYQNRFSSQLLKDGLNVGVYKAIK